jgi:hypothetical protein
LALADCVVDFELAFEGRVAFDDLPVNSGSAHRRLCGAAGQECRREQNAKPPRMIASVAPSPGGGEQLERASAVGFGTTSIFPLWWHF